MPAITTINKQGCFDADVAGQINTSLTNINTVLGAATTAAPTGSGTVVLSTSPTLVTPALGTPSAIVLTNATGLPGASLTAASVTSTQLDPQTIQYQTIQLSNADILALHATPKLLITAAGANTLIEVVSAVIEYVKSTAFTIGSAGNITLNYKSDASGPAISVALAATGFLDQSSSQIRIVKAIATNLDVTANSVNNGVYLSVATADVTGGSGSTGIVKVAFRVHNTLS